MCRVYTSLKLNLANDELAHHEAELHDLWCKMRNSLVLQIRCYERGTVLTRVHRSTPAMFCDSLDL